MKKSLHEKLREVKETTDINILKKYMMDSSWQVRLEVAKNICSDAEVLDYLASDYSLTVKYAVLGDPQILEQTLRMNADKTFTGKGSELLNKNGFKVIPDNQKDYCFDEDEIYDEMPF